jgi:hypothetical protein
VAEEREEKRKKKSDAQAEVMEAGRLLGLIARKDPELYNRLKAYQDVMGGKFTDIIIDALNFYLDYTAFSHIDLKTLLTTMKLVERLGQVLFSMLIGLSQVLSTPLVQAYTGAQITGAEAEAEKEITVAKAQMLKALTPLMNMVMSMLTQTLTRSFQPSLSQPQQISLTPQPSEKPQIKIVKSSEEKTEKETSDINTS